MATHPEREPTRRSVRLTVRITPEVLAGVDATRGAQSRSEYARAALRAEIHRRSNMAQHDHDPSGVAR